MHLEKLIKLYYAIKELLEFKKLNLYSRDDEYKSKINDKLNKLQLIFDDVTAN